MLKNRLYYWGTVVPLSAMLLYMHAQYKDQQAIIDKQHNISNRQVEIMAASYTELLTELSKRHADEIVKLQEHHKKEIGECVAFYDQALSEAVEKTRQQVTSELSP